MRKNGYFPTTEINEIIDSISIFSTIVSSGDPLSLALADGLKIPHFILRSGIRDFEQYRTKMNVHEKVFVTESIQELAIKLRTNSNM
jgi:hypothetical protein